MDEVKTVTGYLLKRLSGNIKRSVTVELCAEEQSEKTASIKQVDNIPCVRDGPPTFQEGLLKQVCMFYFISAMSLLDVIFL